VTADDRAAAAQRERERENEKRKTQQRHINGKLFSDKNKLRRPFYVHKF
jgi:hypothetical protein